MPRPLNVHLRAAGAFKSPSTRGEVVECLCGRFKTTDLAIPVALYRSWRERGFTDRIYCAHCTGNVPSEESV